MRPGSAAAAALVIVSIAQACSSASTVITPSSAVGTGNPSPPAPLDTDDLELIEVTVIRVEDGDSITVELDGREERVRLIGINAPERDECLGDDSRLALVDALGPVIVLGLEPDGRDQFDRLLAHVFSNDTYVNQTQVKSGMAIVVSGDNAFTAELLLTAERTARTNAVGMWSESSCGDGPIQAGVGVTSINADPPGPDEDALDSESVELTNRSGEVVDLGGFVLRDESSVNRFEFPAGTMLGSGDTIGVVSGCAPRNGQLGWCSDVPIWNNSGDSALLLDRDGRVVDHQRY
jgi:endonuclease YncB( thermonuclease family)